MGDEREGSGEFVTGLLTGALVGAALALALAPSAGPDLREQLRAKAAQGRGATPVVGPT